ncbi:MAG: hypothetical protein HY900_35635 [Deltaproteobacteria bacterium]|nr:hypothetical protein [Deltaproteobacteria bacterium]
MAALTLEPCAARVTWRAGEALTSEAWGALLRGFAEAVARRAVEEGAVLVGHIKGIARPAAGGFLHVSAVSGDHPATVQGRVPEGLRELALELVALVYGLPQSTVASVVEDAAREEGCSRSCSTAVERLDSAARFDGLHLEKAP